MNRLEVVGQVAGLQGVPDSVPLAGARLALAVGAAGRRVLGRRRGRPDRASRWRRSSRRRAVPAVHDLHAPCCRRCRSRRPARRTCSALVPPPSTTRRAPSAARLAAQVNGAHALVVGGAGVEAARAVADVRAARDHVRRHALAGGVAHRRRPCRRSPGARLVRAQRVRPASSGSRRCRRTCRCVLHVVCAIAVQTPRGSTVARGDRRAAPERRRQRAAAARARAGLVAADAVDAVVRAGTRWMRCTAARPAWDRRCHSRRRCPVSQSALVVQVLVHSPFRAAERLAILDARRRQVPRPSQVAGGVQPVARAASAAMHSVSRGVLRAAAEAVAQPGLPAARSPGVLADAARVGFVGARSASRSPRGPSGCSETHAPWQATLQQTPSAQKFGDALIVALAAGAFHLLAAAGVLALLSADALAARRAGRRSNRRSTGCTRTARRCASGPACSVRRRRRRTIRRPRRPRTCPACT